MEKLEFRVVVMGVRVSCRRFVVVEAYQPLADRTTMADSPIHSVIRVDSTQMHRKGGPFGGSSFVGLY